VDYLRALDEPSCAASVRLTKGVHLIVAAEHLPINNALVLTDRGGRIVFVMPYQGWILIGTTDTAFDGDPQALKVEKEDISYLLNIVAEALPDFRLNSSDVAYAFAGLRALPIGPTDNPSAIPRDEILIESSSGLITVAGGKLTTHRAIAETIVDRTLSLMNRPIGISSSRVLPLPGARPLADSSDCVKRLPQEIQQALADRYGTRATIVASLIAESCQLVEPIVEGSFVIGAEVIFAVRYELARSLNDFLIRRTSMIWRTPPAAIAAAPKVARLMATELAWSAAREESEIAEFNKLTPSGGLHYC
jgi:glycerol-3-phosphate dehydrogenase